jgi:DNA polymerase III delta prime subunit
VERLHGRAAVLERARLGLEQVCAGRGSLLLFSGEPGIGKSRLAEHVASEALGRGLGVAWGRCWEAGGAPAYWPWIQVFRELGMDDDPFVGLARELGGGAGEARFAAFDRAVRALRLAAVRRPLALVLDDLHAADAPSLLLLLLLARELRAAPLLVVGAYRDAETRARPEIAALLAKIAREAEVLPLGRLSAEDVGAWLREAAPGRDAAHAAALYRVTEGHPLFVVEALRLGARVDALGPWPVGPGVLDERLGDVSASTRALLGAAAVLGRDFHASELAAAAGLAEDAAFEALKEALAASIVVPGARANELRFSHVLLRDRLYAELAPSARAELHWRVGTLMLARGGAPEALIHHLFEGESQGDRRVLGEVALAAAEAELSRLAFENAAQIGRRALPLCEHDARSERVAIALRLVVAEALIRLGDGASGAALCVEAAELAERAALGDLLARAALVYGTELASGTLDPKMIALLRTALARLDAEHSPLRARVMARLAAALTPPRDPAQGPEIVGLMRSAIALARELGDQHALSYVLSLGATVALLIPEQERFAIIAEAVALARALDQRLVLVSTLPAYITALLGRGERAPAEAELARYDQLITEFRQPLHRLRRLLLTSLLCLLSGDFAGATRASEEARELASSASSGPMAILWLTHRLSLAQLHGRAELVAAEAPRLLSHFAAMPSAVPYSTWLLASLGRRTEALERLREAQFEPTEIPSANLMQLMGAAETCLLLEERALAETLYPLLARASDRMLLNLGPGALIGPTARVLGDLARFVGLPQDALRHYDEGIAFGEKLGSPPLIELCRQGREAALRACEAARATPPGTPVGAPAASAGHAPLIARPELRREGELWVLVTPQGRALRLRPSKGIDYLQRLMHRPGRPVHVLELAGSEHRAGDAGVVLDARAKAEYQARLDDLGEALQEAECFADTTRAERVRSEIDALTEQLAAAVGLGGRDRRAASDVERMRINVQRRLKDALDRIAAADPTVGRYLAAAIRTGTYCVYDPL